jgi:putative aminopeptidase FrvX
MLEELKTLTLLNGPSGYEDEVRKYQKKNSSNTHQRILTELVTLLQKKEKEKEKFL